MPASSYRDCIGIAYAQPHGCFNLVRHVFETVYGLELGALDAGVAADPDARSARLHAMLAARCAQVADPAEGDLVLIRSTPWHIGVVIEPPLMLHTYLGGASVVEAWTDFKWAARVAGFYRYCGG